MEEVTLETRFTNWELFNSIIKGVKRTKNIGAKFVTNGTDYIFRIQNAQLHMTTEMVYERFNEIFNNECDNIIETVHDDHKDFVITLVAFRNSASHYFVDLIEKYGTSPITYEYNGEEFKWDVELISEERY